MTLDLDECERQLLLMALAHLAVERPGFDSILATIARRIDNETETGPEMYERFKLFHRPPHKRAWQPVVKPRD